MTDDDILRAVATVAHEHLGYDGVLHPEQRLFEDLELDSIKALTLVVEIENHFRIALEPDIETEIVTVGDLVRAIRTLTDDPR